MNTLFSLVSLGLIGLNGLLGTLACGDKVGAVIMSDKNDVLVHVFHCPANPSMLSCYKNQILLLPPAYVDLSPLCQFPSCSRASQRASFSM